jgi:hypothetical protein
MAMLACGFCNSRLTFLLSFVGRGTWPRWLSRGQFRVKSLLFPVAVLCCAISGQPSWAQLPACALEMPPSEQLGELFRDVQSKKIFHDSKTFADLHYNEAPAAILADYQAHKDEVG